MDLPFHQNASPKLFKNARFLKRVLTPSERKLWRALRSRRFLGLKFRRQHPVSCYIADFYCHSAKLIIEVDGTVHESPDAQAYDDNRTKVLESLGLKVIRFKNHEVEDNINWVLKEIEKHITV